MFGFGLGEVIFVFAIVVLLFGAKRIPQVAKGVGSAIRNFKGSMREGARGDEEETKRLSEKSDSSDS